MCTWVIHPRAMWHRIRDANSWQRIKAKPFSVPYGGNKIVHKDQMCFKCVCVYVWACVRTCVCFPQPMYFSNTVVKGIASISSQGCLGRNLWSYYLFYFLFSPLKKKTFCRRFGVFGICQKNCMKTVIIASEALTLPFLIYSLII